MNKAVPALRGGLSIIPIRGLSDQAPVAADILAEAPITRVRLLIDGLAVSPSRVRYHAAHHRVIYAAVALGPGEHSARLDAWDKTGVASRREWRFRILPSAGAPTPPAPRIDRAVGPARPGATTPGEGHVVQRLWRPI